MDFKSNETIYSQIADHIKKRIFSGQAAPGSRLPAIRDLAKTCQVNPNTVVRVYQELTDEKLVYTDSTNGKFVTPDTAYIAAKREEFLRGKAGRLVEEARETGMGKAEFLRLAEKLWEEKGGSA